MQTISISGFKACRLRLVERGHLFREGCRLDVDVSDPADRFLAATASVCGLTFVTSDRKLRRIPDVRVLPA